MGGPKYLFFIIQPNINISIIASAGINHSATTWVTWNKLYIYYFNIVENSYTLVYIIKNTDSFSTLAGITKSSTAKILKNKNGWYRKEIFLTNNPLPSYSHDTKIIIEYEFKVLLERIKTKSKSGRQVLLVNLVTNTTTIYPSIIACAKFLKISPKVIKHNTIIQNKYQISFLNHPQKSGLKNLAWKNRWLPLGQPLLFTSFFKI